MKKPNRWELHDRASILAQKEAEKIAVAKLDERICKLCGRKFQPKRLKQIYCGIKCPEIGGKKYEI